MERYTKGTISDVSWRDMLSQDPYYGLSNSFQYSENINCDDELHGIKLSQKILSKDSNDFANCQLISAGDRVFAIPQSGGAIRYFDKHNVGFPGKNFTSTGASVSGTVGEATVFQDFLRASYGASVASTFARVNVKSGEVGTVGVIYDHKEDSDESISSIETKFGVMGGGISQVLNFNNTRLVCGVGQNLRVYYPELDKTGETQEDPQTHTQRAVLRGETGWKKVQEFEDGCIIVGLTCDFEYLKVRVQDEGWNTKMYYYPGNNDLRNTFVYNIIDLTGTRVLRVYNINGIDYYTASLDGTDGYITFNKVIGDTPVQIFKQRGGLTGYDINQKAGYFVGPTSIDAGYINGNFYVADAYGVFKFAYNPQGYDTGYLKRKVRDSNELTPGLCVAWNFVFISDQDGLKAMRTYDTGVDGYEAKGILISREMEGDYGGCVAKMLDEIRCHYELNNVGDAEDNPGTIDIYVSPNNLWRDADPTRDNEGWYRVMHIDKNSINTRFEITNQLSKIASGNPAFEFDWQTITYCVVIKSATDPEDEDRAPMRTPVVREVNMRYHLKGKTNNIYDINES